MVVSAEQSSWRPAPFIGRRRERALLLEDLERGAGMISITGLSGIGKTRLAQEVLKEAERSYAAAGGAWFCGIASCRSVAEVEAAVASTLGIPFAHEEQLARAIANRGRLLLVLDGVDWVASRIGGLLSGWLGRSGALQVIATSVVPIGVEEEIHFALGPLEVTDAVDLYLDRASLAREKAHFPAQEASAVEELVGRLDRSPLAIELAAARARELPPRALLSRFADRFELLLPGAGGRQISLAEALTLSWELLTERERALLLLLSVFEGGVTIEAAIAMLEDGTSEAEMLELLDGLRRKALLLTREEAPPRFFFMESVRDFARKHLESSGLQEVALARRSNHLIEQGEWQAGRLEGPDFRRAIAWIQAAREDLTAILRHEAAERPAIGARAGLVLFSLLNFWGYPGESLELLDVALEAARRSFDSGLIARVLRCRGIALVPKGMVSEALVALEEAVARAGEHGDRVEEANALIRLAYARQWVGELPEADALLDRAVAIAREAKAPDVEASALLFRGIGAQGAGELDKAESCFDQTLTLVRRHGQLRRAGMVSLWLGGIYLERGRFREARRALQDVAARAKEDGNRTLEATALTNLGAVEFASGLLEEGERVTLRALALLREDGSVANEGVVVGNLGCLALERGESEGARRLLTEAAQILEECGDRRGLSWVLPFLAVCEARDGKPAEAIAHMRRAREHYEKVGDLYGRSLISILEGSLELAEARRLASTQAGAAEMRVAQARERLQLAQAVDNPARAGVSVAIRILERDLEGWAAGFRRSASQPESEGLRVGPKASWFEASGAARVDLRRRLSIRRMLDALVETSLDSPGEPLSAQRLFEAGWPGVNIAPEAAMRRVYWGVWTLRDLGLAEILQGKATGYFLDPTVRVSRLRE